MGGGGATRLASGRVAGGFVGGGSVLVECPEAGFADSGGGAGAGATFSQLPSADRSPCSPAARRRFGRSGVCGIENQSPDFGPPFESSEPTCTPHNRPTKAATRLPAARPPCQQRRRLWGCSRTQGERRVNRARRQEIEPLECSPLGRATTAWLETHPSKGAARWQQTIMTAEPTSSRRSPRI